MKRRLGQLAAALCGLVLWLVCIMYQEPSKITGSQEWFRVLSNGALLPGVLFVGISVMVRIADDGLFDGIRYSMSSMLSRLRGEDKRYATYYDYTRREKKKGAGYPMLLPGLFFLAAAVVLTLLYYL